MGKVSFGGMSDNFIVAQHTGCHKGFLNIVYSKTALCWVVSSYNASLPLQLGIEPRIADVTPFPSNFPVILCGKKGCIDLPYQQR